MKKFCVYILVLFIFISLLSFPALAEDVSVTGGCNSLDAMVPFFGTQKQIENAVSAILYEANTDTLLYADNVDERLPPVSLVKILTAIIAMLRSRRVLWLSLSLTLRSMALRA